MKRSKWRLLEYSVKDPRFNLAVDEALLRSRQEESSIDTIRLWENSKAVVLGSTGNAEYAVNLETCSRNRTPVTRRISSGSTVYHDHDSLNFTIVLSEKSFPLPKDLLNAYKLLYEGVAKALRILGVKVQIDDYGQSLMVGNRAISEAGQHFFYDLMIFQGTIYVNTEIERLGEILKEHETTVTSLSKEAGTIIPMEKVRQHLVESFQNTLDVELEKGGITDHEQALAQRLYEMKYSKRDWNIEGKEPLSLSDVLIEVYVAYPPTSKCKHIMEMVNTVAAKYPERVEVRTWMRGAGLSGRGRVGDIVMSAALRKAAKDSIIPAVIINGDIVFEKTVPSEGQLADVVSKQLL